MKKKISLLALILVFALTSMSFAELSYTILDNTYIPGYTEDAEDTEDNNTSEGLRDELGRLITVVPEKLNTVYIYTENSSEPKSIQSIKAALFDAVPLREFFETFGAHVSWNDIERSVLISKGAGNSKVFAGRHFAYIDGKRKSTDIAPFFMDGQIWVSLKFACEAMNVKPTYNQNAQSITIDSKKFNIKPVDEADKDFDGLTCYYQTSEASLWANVSDTELNILVDGVLSDNAEIYIDFDDSINTGYKAWQWYDFGADYVFELDGIISYPKSTEDDMDYEEVISTAKLTYKNNRLYASIPFKDVKFNKNSSLKIGVYSRNGDARQSVPALKTESVVLGAAKLFTSIPYAIGMGIDDLGWLRFHFENSGTAHTREADIWDYNNIIEVGKNAGTRIMTAWILGDLDKDASIITDPYRNPPYTQSLLTGYGFTPDPVNTEYTERIMRLVEDEAAYLEFGLHGVGHENFFFSSEVEGKILYNRAEWAKKIDKGVSEPWDEHTMNVKAQAYLDIIRQYYDEETCSFPTSFVPPAHGYFYEEGNLQSTGTILGNWGVKYANFATANATSIGDGVIDNHVLAIDRAPGANYYYEHATPWTGDWIRYEAPDYPTDKYGWVEAHFPNYWNDRNKTSRNDAVHDWSEYLIGINKSVDRVLPPNTAVCSSQWLYHKYGKLSSTNETAEIDLTGMPHEAYNQGMLTPIIMKVELKDKKISDLKISNGGQLFGYYEDDFGHAYLIIGDPSFFMGRLERQKYTVSYKLSDSSDLKNYVDLTKSTFTLYSYTTNAAESVASIEIYGEQDIKINVSKTPVEVFSNNNNLVIKGWYVDGNTLVIRARGKNIQGEKGKITIKY